MPHRIGGMLLLREVCVSRPFLPVVGGQPARRAAAPALQASTLIYQNETCTCHAAQSDTPAARGPQQGIRDAQQAALSRRSALALSAALVMGSTGSAAGSDLAGPPQPANIRPELAPDQASYDASDERLRDAAQMLQQSLNAESVQAGSRWGAGPRVEQFLAPSLRRLSTDTARAGGGEAVGCADRQV